MGKGKFIGTGIFWGLLSMLPYFAMVGGYSKPNLILQIFTFPAFIVFNSQEILYPTLIKILNWDLWIILQKFFLLLPPLIGAAIGFFLFRLLQKRKD